METDCRFSCVLKVDSCELLAAMGNSKKHKSALGYLNFEKAH